MFGWLSILKAALGLLGKFKSQQKVKVANELKLESYNLHKRKAELEALEKSNEKIDDFKSYLSRS